jgi:hypothetical protein
LAQAEQVLLINLLQPMEVHLLSLQSVLLAVVVVDTMLMVLRVVQVQVAEQITQLIKQAEQETLVVIHLLKDTQAVQARMAIHITEQVAVADQVKLVLTQS